MSGFGVRLGSAVLTLVALALTLTGCNQAVSPGFTLTLSPAQLSTGLDDSATTTLSLTSQGGFTGPVDLSLLDAEGHHVSGAALDPESVTLPAGQRLALLVKVTPAASLPAGTFRFTLSATGGGVTHAVPLTLVLASTAIGTFGGVSSYPAGSSSHWVVKADFNGDGKMDLAVANDNGNGADPGTVSVLLGNGSGGFQAPQTYATGACPYFLAVGDFNGDGKPDLATVTNCGGNVVSVLLNNGDGSFGNASSYPVGGAPLAVTVADFNGDGFLDLAVANAADGTVSVLLGNGDGTFQNQATYTVGSWPIGLAVGDFNGDGTPDIAVANETDNTVSVLLNNGDGTFPTGGAPAYTVGSDPVSVAVGDFNGDGKPDIAVANSGQSVPGSVSVLLNNGDGTFPTTGAPAYTVGSFTRSVAVGDFNGDGKPDIAVANSGQSGAGSVSVLLNNGDGTFPSSGAPTYTVGSYPKGLAVGDFNGDGKLDLAVANTGSGTVSVLLGQ